MLDEKTINSTYYNKRLKKWDLGWKFRLFIRGVKYKYPLCCIIGFIKDFNDDSEEADVRRTLSVQCVDHIMCKKCFKRKFG